MSAWPARAIGCSRRSAPRTTGSGRCSRSVRIRAGGGSSWRACPSDAGHVLDVATGTGLVAPDLLGRGLSRHGAGSEHRDAGGRRRLRFDGRVALVEGNANALPFDSEAFDHLTFTYLLRYHVDDPDADDSESWRGSLVPGDEVAMLEFAVPRGVWLPLWRGLYVRRRASRGWQEPCSRRAGAKSADFLGGLDPRVLVAASGGERLLHRLARGGHRRPPDCSG